MSTRPATANQEPARPVNPRAGAMTKGRQADSARRRQRVITALGKAVSDGTEISVAGIARAAGVDRTFFYRHRDLLAQLHALEATPPATGHSNGPGVSRASLQTDLLAAGARAARLYRRVQQLEKRLSEALGEQAWRESGLGTPADIDTLNQKIIYLEQQAIDLRLQLEEHRPAPAARGTRRRSRRRPGHQPRAHGPAQHRSQTPVTRRTRTLHHTCRRH